MERQPEAERVSLSVMIKRICNEALWEYEFCENMSQIIFNKTTKWYVLD